MQGTFNGELKKIDVFTKITDLKELERICEIDKVIQNENNTTLTKDKHFVKKNSMNLMTDN